MLLDRLEHLRRLLEPGRPAARLLAKRAGLSKGYGDALPDLALAFAYCPDCRRPAPEPAWTQLLGEGAERAEDLAALLGNAPFERRAVTCPECKRTLPPDGADWRLLATYSSATSAELLTLVDHEGQTVWFEWTDGGPVALDDRGRLLPFLAASAYRKALGQVEFPGGWPSALGTCLRLDPDFVPGLELAAQVRLGQGRLTEALALFERVLERDPGRARAWHGLGLGLAELFRQAPTRENVPLAARAVQCLQRSLDIEDSAGTHRSLGSVLLMLGKDEAALAHLQRAHDADPDHETTRFHLAMALMGTGDHARALRLLDGLGDTDDPSVSLRRAECLAAMGRSEEARRELERSASLGADPGRIARIRDSLS